MGAIMGRTGSELRTLSHSSVLLVLALISASAAAAPDDEEEGPRRNWYLVPSVELAEIYSDNINLAPSGREDWDLVTEITPGLELHGESARVKADVNYRIQNLLYVHEPSRSTTNHRFNGNATAEVVDEHLFFDTEALVSQVVIDPSTAAGYDAINGVARSDVYSLRMGPRYQQNLGGWARLNAGYSYGIVRYGSSGGASDSDVSRADLNVGSGRRFTRLGWNLSYYNEQIDRGSESRIGDVTHEVAVVDLSYALSRHFSVIARAGDETHEFDTRQQGFQNGTYTAAGFQWRPNRHTKIDALYGDRYQSASVAWSPTRRTSLDVQWVDTQVGAIVGTSWNANASLRTRRTRWALTYLEQPGTVQSLTFGQAVFLFQDPLTGIFYPEPAPGREPIFVGNAFSFTDEVFIRRRGQASFGFETARTTSSVIIYDEEREYTASGELESDQGINAAVNWRFAPRTSWLNDLHWSQRQLRTSNSSFDVWRLETGLQQKIARNATGTVTVSHAERTSGVGRGGYDENRISVRLYMQF